MGIIKSFLIIILLAPSFPAESKTYCVGHRGNVKDQLENSIAGIKSALDLGLWGVEFDVHHSMDGQAIINHDDTFRRTALLSDPLDQEIAKCPFDSKISDIDYRQIKNHCRLSNKENIPTLEDTFKLFKERPEANAFLEYKDQPNIQDLILMKEYFEKRPEKLWVLSFEASALDFVGRYRATPGFEFLKQVKLIHLRFFGSAGAFHHDGIDVHIFNDASLGDIRNEDKIIGVWTYDDATNLQEFFDKEVDFITTNRPQACLRIQNKT